MRKLSRKGSGLFSSGAERKMIRKGSATKRDIEAFDSDFLKEDVSGIPIMNGALKKMSRKGRWQVRYFRVNSNYFMYSKSVEMSEVRCVHDVCMFEGCEVVGRFGHFNISFKESKSIEPMMHLKANNLEEAENWVDNLLMRKNYFESRLQNANGNGKLSGKAYNIIERYETISDSGDRFKQYADRFRNSFQQPHIITIEKKIGVLQPFLDELLDTFSVCLIEHKRPEVLLDHFSSACPQITFALDNCLSSDADIEAHEALKLIIFISNLKALLLDVKTSATMQQFSAKTNDPKIKLTEYVSNYERMLESCTHAYILSAGGDLMKMSLNIATFVLQNPNKAIQSKPNGIVFSTGARDLLGLVHQYIKLSKQASNYKALCAEVLYMIRDPICAFIHAMDLRVAQVRHLLLNSHPGESLLFLCVVINDSTLIRDSVEGLAEEHMEELEVDFKCSRLSEKLYVMVNESLEHIDIMTNKSIRLSAFQMMRVLFDDLDSAFKNLFSTDITLDDSDLTLEPELETVFSTLDDYFEDICQRINVDSFIWLLGYCANRALSAFVEKWIDTYTETSSKGWRVAKKKFFGHSRVKACHRLEKGLETILKFFDTTGESRGKKVYRGLERTFSNQVSFSNFVLDVAFRVPLSSLVSQVLSPTLQIFKLQKSAIAHIYALFLMLTLVRDFEKATLEWKAAFPDAFHGDDQHFEFPYSRKTLLRKSIRDLPYKVEELQNSLNDDAINLATMFSRLPTTKEMDLRNRGTKEQEILVGDQAEAALDIVKVDNERIIYLGVFTGRVTALSQIQHDVTIANSKSKHSLKRAASNIITSLKVKNLGITQTRESSSSMDKSHDRLASSDSNERRRAAVNQARELFASHAITKGEYLELMQCFDQYLPCSHISHDVVKAQKLWLRKCLSSHFSEFSKISETMQDSLVNCMRMEIHCGGKPIMKQGEYGNFMMVIGTGYFNVIVRKNAVLNNGGSISGNLSLSIATLGPGSVCGELSLLFETRRNATVILSSGEKKAVIWCISKVDFDRAMASGTEAELALLRDQFAADPRFRHHISKSINNDKSISIKLKKLIGQKQQAGKRSSLIAKPGEFHESDDTLDAPDLETIRSLHENDNALLALA